MTGSSLGNVDLGEILFTFQNIDEFPEVWVICSCIGFCPGVFCLGVFLSRGLLSGGFL